MKLINKNMRIFLSVLILIFGLQSLTKADDINEFEIEGISTGDSLLNFYSESEINKNLGNYYNDDEFLVTVLPTLENDSMYQYIQVHFKKNDKEYFVYSIDGMIDIDIKKCIEMQKSVNKELSSLFKNITSDGPYTQPHLADKTGKSKTIHITWYFSNDDLIDIVCYDFVKPMTWPDGLNVSISKGELLEWLRNKAYN